MPFIKRDTQGRIIALFAQEEAGAQERMAASDSEVLDFLSHCDGDEVPHQFLTTTDTELVRVVEDLIELLVDKNMLLFTELPSAAQQKLINRKRAREAMEGDGEVMIGKEDIL